MRKRNKLLIFLIFVLLMPCLTAQNTGYMGKRVIVNMGADFSPAWRRPINMTIQPKYLAFNTILSPSIEIITHKGGTAGLVYHFLSTKYNTPLKEDESFTIIWIDSIYDPDLPVLTDLKSHGFGIFYKQYLQNGRGRSPIGPYFRMQFDGFFFQCPDSYEDRTITMSDRLFAMKLEVGNDFLLFNRLRLSTGFSLGIPFGGYRGLALDNEFIGEFSNFYTKPLNEYARSRILGAYWLGFTVNIGFLAF